MNVITNPNQPMFRKQMIDLVRDEYALEPLGHEFEPTAKRLHNWIKQAADHGDTPSCSRCVRFRPGGLPTRFPRMSYSGRQAPRPTVGGKPLVFGVTNTNYPSKKIFLADSRVCGEPTVRPVIAFIRSRRAARFLVSRSLSAAAIDSCLSLRKPSTFDVDSCTLLNASRVRASGRLSRGRSGQKRSMSTVAPSATLASNRFPGNVHVPHARLRRYPASRPARGGRAGCRVGVLAQHGGVISPRGAIRLIRSCQKESARSSRARMSARLNPYPATTSAAISSHLPGQRPKTGYRLRGTHEIHRVHLIDYRQRQAGQRSAIAHDD